MTRERLWTRIDLRCLSRHSTDQLVRALLPGVAVSDTLLAEIYEQSRGNPLFVRELADVMRGVPLPPVGSHQQAAWLTARLPARTRALTDLRLALMDKPLHRLLCLAAMAGSKEISLSQLRAGAAALELPLPPAMLFDALDSGLRMRLLEEREGGSRVPSPGRPCRARGQPAQAPQGRVPRGACHVQARHIGSIGRIRARRDAARPRRCHWKSGGSGCGHACGYAARHARRNSGTLIRRACRARKGIGGRR